MVFRSMADQVGVATDSGSARTFEAAEDILQGQVVKLDSNSAGRTVEPSDTDGEAAYGVAAYDAAAGDQVLVYGPGCVVRATSGTGTVASGDLVTSYGGTGEEGEVDTATATDVGSSTNGDSVLGIALEDDAGTNNDVIVEITPGGIA